MRNGKISQRKENKLRQSKWECSKKRRHETWHGTVNCGSWSYMIDVCSLALHNQFKYIDYQLFLLFTVLHQSSLRRLGFLVGFLVFLGDLDTWTKQLNLKFLFWIRKLFTYVGMCYVYSTIWSSLGPVPVDPQRCHNSSPRGLITCGLKGVLFLL